MSRRKTSNNHFALKELTVPELKKLCVNNGLTVSGTKDELIKRIIKGPRLSNITDSAGPTVQKKLKTNKKEIIPSTVKNIVWNTYIGSEYKEGLCLCCSGETISTATFHCGHVVSEKNGGSLIIDNLRPICGQCNSSIGSKNMEEFMARYGIQKPENWYGCIEQSFVNIPRTSPNINAPKPIDYSRLGINGSICMRHVSNIQQNDINFLSNLIKLRENEKIEILYLESHDHYGKIGFGDTFVGITNFGIFSLHRGLIDYQNLSDVTKITHKSNGWLESDEILCFLRNSQIKSIPLFWASECGYFCNYLQGRINLRQNVTYQ